MKPPVDAPRSRQSLPRRVDAQDVERVRELLAPAGDEARRPLDLERDVVGDLLPRLVVARHETRQDESLGLRAALREPALHEHDVEALLHGLRVEGGVSEARHRVTLPVGERLAPSWHGVVTHLGVGSQLGSAAGGGLGCPEGSAERTWPIWTSAASRPRAVRRRIARVLRSP